MTPERLAEIRRYATPTGGSCLRTALEELLAEVDRLQALADALGESCAMACETPAPRCDCAGCRYADERMAGGTP